MMNCNIDLYIIDFNIVKGHRLQCNQEICSVQCLLVRRECSLQTSTSANLPPPTIVQPSNHQ